MVAHQAAARLVDFGLTFEDCALRLGGEFGVQLRHLRVVLGVHDGLFKSEKFLADGLNGFDASPQPSPVEAARERRARSDVPHPPPPPSQVLDGTGWPIPTQLIPLWQRSGEVQEMLTTLSRVKGALRTAQQTKDIPFAEVLFSSALSQLEQAWMDIKTAKPFAVCPTCQGQVPDICRMCHGRGLISEFRWNTCVSREDKEFRSKARKSTTDEHG